MLYVYVKFILKNIVLKRPDAMFVTCENLLLLISIKRVPTLTSGHRLDCVDRVEKCVTDIPPLGGYYFPL